MEPTHRQRKAPKRITESYLRNLLNWYLERWDAPKKHVRRLMMQRVRRAVAYHEQDLAECTELLDKTLDRLEELGVIDDRRWAENALRSMRGRGKSTRFIRQAMGAKGVSSSLVAELLEEEREDRGEEPDAEWVACIRYAKKRRFGPFRRPDQREDRRDKDLASMVRNGFNYGMARKVVDTPDQETLLADLPLGW